MKKVKLRMKKDAGFEGRPQSPLVSLGNASVRTSNVGSVPALAAVGDDDVVLVAAALVFFAGGASPSSSSLPSSSLGVLLSSYAPPSSSSSIVSLIRFRGDPDDAIAPSMQQR